MKQSAEYLAVFVHVHFMRLNNSHRIRRTHTNTLTHSGDVVRWKAKEKFNLCSDAQKSQTATCTAIDDDDGTTATIQTIQLIYGECSRQDRR